MSGKWVSFFVLGLIASTVLALGFTEPPKKPTTTKDALDIAIDDERHATAFYQAVMAKHGERRPFANIIHAERRHEAALLAQYERLELKPPPNRWADHKFDVPDTFAEACDASIVAEIRNGRIYDDLLAATDDEQVRQVFENLRWASVERHLRAFRRHGSGWTEVSRKDMTNRQQQQRKTAENARHDMFGKLLAELMGTIQKEGTDGAVNVCAKRPPEIAQEAGKQYNVKIGRTSFRLRNANNQPPVWAALWVDERVNEKRYLADDNGRLGVLTPIKLSSTCIQCHGDPNQMSPALKANLKKHYPNDMATGFKINDLRGWFWVEVPGDES